jgi:hypothetical protein
MNQNDYEPGESPIICNLTPGLVERGKIKIGRKGKWVRETFQQPEKIDHFLVTTLEKDATDNNFIVDNVLMKKLLKEQGVEILKKIPVRLLYDDIVLNYQSRFACFRGRTRWCSGDGRGAFRLNSENKYEPIKCPCERAHPDYAGEDKNGKGKCKMNCSLSVIIDGAESVGGIWKFRTTGYYSVTGILSSLMLVKSLTRGFLAGLKLNMVVYPKTTDKGKIFVVTIEYPGTIEQLKSEGLKIALNEEKIVQRIENLETEARKLLSAEYALVTPGEEIDHVEEFYPEDATPVSAPPPLAAPSTPAPVVTAPVAQSDPAASPAPVTHPASPAPEQPQPAEKKPKSESRKSKRAATTTAEPEPVPPPPEPVVAPLSVPVGMEDLNLFDMEQ